MAEKQKNTPEKRFAISWKYSKNTPEMLQKIHFAKVWKYSKNTPEKQFGPLRGPNLFILVFFKYFQTLEKCIS